MFNVHTLGGKDMMTAAVRAASTVAEKTSRPRPKVLGVTVLTSIDQMTMNNDLRVSGSVVDQVVHLATLAQSAGLDGVIASPHEIEAIRSAVSPSMLVVTPGVRPKWAATQDQRRIMTPGEAILKGASFVVIGRPITQPPPEIGSPVNAARMISEEIENALQKESRTC